MESSPPGQSVENPASGRGTSSPNPGMFRLLRGVWTKRELVKAFVVRDLKSRYVGSAMGFFWSVVVPFIYLFVFMVVFSLLLKSRWTDGARPQDTALFMLVGILSWHAFAETLSRATNCLVEHANLIQKVVFPAEILPAFLTVSSIVNMLIGLPIVVVGTYVFADKVPGIAYLALPILIVLQGLFTLGLGYFLSAMNLFLRDTYHVIGVLTLVWMFGTPIFYPPTLVNNARVPVPGTAKNVDVWVKHDIGRRRIPLTGKVTVSVDETRRPRRFWEMEADLETYSPEVREFLEPNERDDRPREAMPDAIPPESLDSYVTVSGVLHRREVAEQRDTMSLGLLLEVNPMFWLINSYRRVLMFGEWPRWRLVLRFAIVSLVFLAIGSRFFARHQRRFADLL